MLSSYSTAANTKADLSTSKHPTSKVADAAKTTHVNAMQDGHSAKTARMATVMAAHKSACGQ